MSEFQREEVEDTESRLEWVLTTAVGNRTACAYLPDHPALAGSGTEAQPTPIDPYCAPLSFQILLSQPNAWLGTKY